MGENRLRLWHGLRTCPGKGTFSKANGVGWSLSALPGWARGEYAGQPDGRALWAQFVQPEEYIAYFEDSAGLHDV